MDNTRKCRKHGKSRLIKFMEEVKVYDAHGKVIRVDYECRKDSECTVNRFSGVPMSGEAPEGAIEAPSALLAGMQNQNQASAPEPGDQPKTKGRYYDLSKRDRGAQKKVCFGCGMPDHERSECPNKFCFRCHQMFGADETHRCVDPVTPSPFLAGLPPNERGLRDEDFADVCCLYCGENGHFDCRPNISVVQKELSCSFCAGGGHSGPQCPSRNPTKWERMHESISVGGQTHHRYHRDPPERYDSRHELEWQQSGSSRRRGREDDDYGREDDSFSHRRFSHHHQHGHHARQSTDWHEGGSRYAAQGGLSHRAGHDYGDYQQGQQRYQEQNYSGSRQEQQGFERYGGGGNRWTRRY